MTLEMESKLPSHSGNFGTFSTKLCKKERRFPSAEASFLTDAIGNLLFPGY
jgi:hypothetical protein